METSTWFIEVAKQVPALVVLGIVVYYFLSHLKMRDTAFLEYISHRDTQDKEVHSIWQAKAQALHDAAMKASESLIATVNENTKLLGRTAQLLDQLDRK